jgi:hypothetical protein
VVGRWYPRRLMGTTAIGTHSATTSAFIVIP